MTERLSDKNPCDNCKLYSPCTGPCGKWHEWNQDVLKKLAEYEAAEEEGRLVMLPCKVGDAVYEICSRYTKCTPYKNEFSKSSCYGCEEECDSQKLYAILEGRPLHLEDIVWHIRCGHFGKTVFLTREEAEKALKEMRKE